MEQELVVVVSAMGDTTDILSNKARQLSGRPPERELDALVLEKESAVLQDVHLNLLTDIYGVPSTASEDNSGQHYKKAR